MTESRRKFLGVAGAAGAVAAVGFAGTGKRVADAALGREPSSHRYYGQAPSPEFSVDPRTGRVDPNPAQQVSYTGCLGCTSQCGIRVRVDRGSGQVLRVAGNPYSPLSADPPLPYKTPIAASFAALSRRGEEGLDRRATACGRGNAVAELLHSPHRVLTPLKRVGARNGGRWVPISMEQLVRELSEGGDLFGEGRVAGLRELRDLKTPIDPAAPELGPRVNQVAVLSAADDGRAAFARRFMQKAYGTINFVGHGSYCGGAYRSASGALFNDMKRMPHAKPDLDHAEFVLFVGTAPGNAGNPFKRQGQLLARARSSGGLRYAVVDPVLGHASQLAAGERSRWIPIRPGTDGALGMALIRWILDNGRHDANFLAQPSPAAAAAAGEAAWCNATHLVVAQKGHPREGRFVRGSDLGLPVLEAQRYKDEDPYVVVDPATGKPVASTQAGGPAALFFEGEIDAAGQPLAVRTSLAALRQESRRHSLQDYADACGIPLETIAELAQELTSHGKRAAVSLHGGMMAGNGFYNGYSLMTINALIGNLNRKGGLLMNGGRFRDDGPGPRYDLENFDGQIKPSGTPLGRNVPYEKSAEFARRKAEGKAYPARAPWFPNAPGLATEWLTGAAAGYPYALSALVLWNANPIYGIPGLRALADEYLADPKRLPLLIAIDPYINESSAYADYIVPDTHAYESWGWAAAWNGVPTKCSTARWPVVEPATLRSAQGEPAGMESFFIALARQLGLPGFGPGAIKDAEGGSHPLERAQDWYLRGGANVAFLGKEPVPDASDEDLILSGVERLRPRLQATLKPDEWRKVAFVLARGGRFQPQAETYDKEHPDWATNRHAGGLQIYNENLGAAKDSLTGRRFVGTATWTPPAFADGTPVRVRYPEAQWPLQLVSHKSPLQNSYSIGATRLRRLHPDSPVAMHPQDAQRLGIADGDEIEIATPGGRARATVRVRSGVAPGVVAVEHGYGHRELGARAHRIGDARQPDGEGFGAGFNLNDLGLADPTRAQQGLWVDPVAGTAVRNGLPARVGRV